MTAELTEAYSDMNYSEIILNDRLYRRCLRSVIQITVHMNEAI